MEASLLGNDCNWSPGYADGLQARSRNCSPERGDNGQGGAIECKNGGGRNRGHRSEARHDDRLNCRWQIHPR